MGVDLTFEIEGEKQVSAELGMIADHIKDWDSPLQKTGQILLKSFDMNFDSRGKIFQGGWPKRKVDKPWPILEKTKTLRESFFAAATDRSVVLGNTTEYFRYHQSNQKRTVLPRRIMMKIDDASRLKIVKAFQEHILNLGGSARR